MSKMQEHIFDDVHGRTVCRKCRVITVFRNANSLAFPRYHAFASGAGRKHIFDDVHGGTVCRNCRERCCDDEITVS